MVYIVINSNLRCTDVDVMMTLQTYVALMLMSC